MTTSLSDLWAEYRPRHPDRRSDERAVTESLPAWLLLVATGAALIVASLRASDAQVRSRWFGLAIVVGGACLGVIVVSTVTGG